MAKKRNLACCVCGDYAGRWQQHWNRDTGFGICARCVAWLRSRGTGEAEIADCYGKAGVNFAPAVEPEDDAAMIEEARAICGRVEL